MSEVHNRIVKLIKRFPIRKLTLTYSAEKQRIWIA